MSEIAQAPKVLIGLGNPDVKYLETRHNAGFKVIDAVAAKYGGHLKSVGDKEMATFSLNGHSVLLIKPLTYMNNSGDVVPFLKKKGIGPADILVIHDELEKPLGKLALKMGGSARGHNGLKSLIERWGTPEFARLRFGIGRPEAKEQVPHYVLERFENSSQVDLYVQDAVQLIEHLYSMSR
jgi:PTH1 family peptidyl-tRNA hydrolase